MRRTTILIALALLSACGGEDQSTAPSTLSVTPQLIAYADRANPDDPALAEIYNRSCRSCHSVHGMNAPLTGHAADWDARINERGLDGLLQSAKTGYNMMPAMGMCIDCSDEQFVGLITFMAQEPTQ